MGLERKENVETVARNTVSIPHGGLRTATQQAKVFIQKKSPSHTVGLEQAVIDSRLPGMINTVSIPHGGLRTKTQTQPTLAYGSPSHTVGLERQLSAFQGVDVKFMSPSHTVGLELWLGSSLWRG